MIVLQLSSSPKQSLNFPDLELTLCFPSKVRRIREDGDSVTTPTEGEKQTEKRVYRWQKSQPPEKNTDFRGTPFTIPDGSVRDMTPLDCFKLFWDDNVIKMFVEQTNLYSVQTTGNSIRTNIKEIGQLTGMQMMMSLI